MALAGFSSSFTAPANAVNSFVDFCMDPLGILTKLIIRPPRAVYGLEELGRTVFTIDGSMFVREDTTLRNDRGQRLECSHFRHSSPEKRCLPCVVYVHGSSACRLEALDVVHILLQSGMTVFCFDSAGSGRSDGDYVSLGHYEERDLKVVLSHIRALKTVSTIGLWGRSMGAATAIYRAAATSEDIRAMVLDSSYSHLPSVVREAAESMNLKVPDFIWHVLIQRVREAILSNANFDMESLSPLQKAPAIMVPALFATALDDTVVLPHHSKRLHNAWGSPHKRFVSFEGGHNGIRPRWFLHIAAGFLLKRLTENERQNSNFEMLGLHKSSGDVMPHLDTSPSSVSTCESNAGVRASLSEEEERYLSWVTGGVCQTPSENDRRSVSPNPSTRFAPPRRGSPYLNASSNEGDRDCGVGELQQQQQPESRLTSRTEGDDRASGHCIGFNLDSCRPLLARAAPVAAGTNGPQVMSPPPVARRLLDSVYANVADQILRANEPCQEEQHKTSLRTPSHDACAGAPADDVVQSDLSNFHLSAPVAVETHRLQDGPIPCGPGIQHRRLVVGRPLRVGSTCDLDIAAIRTPWTIGAGDVQLGQRPLSAPSSPVRVRSGRCAGADFDFSWKVGVA